MTRRSISDLLGLDAAEARPVTVDANPSRIRSAGRDLALVGGAHEGASRYNKEMSLWNPALRSGDADTLYDRERVTARARDITRNDAYVQAGTQLHKDGVVGSVYMLNCKPNVRALGIKDDDGKWEAEFAEEVETKFTLWAESPENWVDASRHNTLTGLIRLAVGTYLAGGEILASAEWMRQRSDRPYQTAIQMIEADRLSNPFGTISQGSIRGGIERDRYGAPQNYWIRNSHPSDVSTENPQNAWQWTAYPARMAWGRQRIIHVFEQTRIDQTRGISDMVAALKEMRTTKHFRDIQLQNAIVNATFAASIESELPQQSADALGATDDEAFLEYAQNYLGAVHAYSGNSDGLAISGVRIPHLFPGQKLQLRPAGKGGPLGTEFESSLLRYIAAILGVSYEELSRDYSQSNYSSMRAALNQTDRYMSARKRLVADKVATSIFRLWFEEARGKGDIDAIKGKPEFYDGMNKDAYTQCDWLGVGRDQIDELKETQAAVLRLNNNLSTLERELARIHGQDWRAVLKQRKREKDLIDELGLTPPEQDPNMMNALSGDEKTPNDSQPSKKEKKKGPADA